MTTKGGELMGTDMAVPGANVVSAERMEVRKAKRTQLDAAKGPATWLVLPEEICVAGVDYPADPADPFFDERSLLALDPGLIDDIDINGVRQPVTVVKDGDVAKAKDGRRRVLHARAANKRRVERGEPALRIMAFLDSGDAQQIFLGARRANAYRVDDGILQKARNAQRAIQNFGATIESVAGAENTTPRNVKDWLAILELGVDARQAIETGQISPSGALKLLKDVPRKDQARVLGEQLAAAGGKRITTGAAEAGAKNERTKRSTPEGEAPTPEKEASPAPPKRTAKKLLLGYEQGKAFLFDEKEGEQLLTDAFMLGVRWMMGDASARAVKGLSPALRKLGVV